MPDCFGVSDRECRVPQRWATAVTSTATAENDRGTGGGEESEDKARRKYGGGGGERMLTSEADSKRTAATVWVEQVKRGGTSGRRREGGVAMRKGDWTRVGARWIVTAIIVFSQTALIV